MTAVAPAVVPNPSVAAATTASRSRSVVTTGRVLTAVGALVLLFVLYTIFGSALEQRRAQDLLLREFRRDLAVQADAKSRGGTIGGGSGLLGGPATTVPTRPYDIAPPRPALGAPVALLQIPRLRVTQVVVEGTNHAQLRDGPGHHRNTVMPGEPGNAAISGPRLANGGPFRDLDRLRAGDDIQVTTLSGSFLYRVRTVRTASAGDPDPLEPTTTNQLTLLTSDPVGIADQLLVVTADLRTQPVAPPAGRRALDAPASENGMSPQAGAWATTILALQLLLLVAWGARWLYRTWRPATAWIVTTPVLLAALVIFFHQAAGLVPATY